MTVAETFREFLSALFFRKMMDYEDQKSPVTGPGMQLDEVSEEKSACANHLAPAGMLHLFLLNSCS